MSSIVLNGQNDDLVLVKGNEQLQIFNSSKTLEKVVGSEETEYFDSTKNYAKGDFVIYENELYKFVQIHTAGVWNINHVTKTSVFKEIDTMVKNDYEEVIITLKNESNEPLEDVLVAIQVEGEMNARNLTSDSEGVCTTTITKGLEYTVSCNSVEGYYNVETISKRASLPTRYIYVTYIEDETLTMEHVKIKITYSATPTVPASTVTIRYDGVDHVLTVSDNIAETDVAIGTVYTVIFTEVDGYYKPSNIIHEAEHHGTRIVPARYIKIEEEGIRWLMKNNTTKSISEITAQEEDNIFGLIISTSTLLNNGGAFVIPYPYLLNKVGSGQWLDVAEDVPSLSHFQTHANALNDVDGERNCEKIEEYITQKAEAGVTRTSSMVSICRNRVGGVPTFSTETEYSTNDYVIYSGKIYQFNTTHQGVWDTNDVTEIGYGWMMPDGIIRKCFQPAYGQLYTFSLNRDSVNAKVQELFGKVIINVLRELWWSSSQYSAAYGVFLSDGGFGSNFKSYSFFVLPCLAY